MRLAARALLPGLVLLTAALAAPALAGAAAVPVGSATLVFEQSAWRGLGARGIGIEGIDGASRQGRRLRLDVDGGTIGATTAQLSGDGALVLSGEEAALRTRPKGRGLGGGKERAVKLSGLRLELGADSTLSAMIDRKRRAVFDLGRAAPSLDASLGSASLEAARLSWRPGVRRLLGKRLGATLPAGPLGTLSLRVATVLTETPKAGPIGGAAPPIPTRPASAVDVTTATLSWHVRDSFIRYINTQEAPQAFDGAIAEPAVPESSHPCPNRPATTNPTLVYSYDFPFAGGWYDPPSQTAALQFSGGVRFSYPSHGIDITARGPEIDLGPGGSRAIFSLRGGAETAYPEQRATLLELVPGAPTESTAGHFGFPTPPRAKLSSDGQQVFAGFYPPPDDSFGCFGVSFSTGS
ncbi:MAG: HtaA domain-containing protein [Solirubrobacterales bacterium]